MNKVELSINRFLKLKFLTKIILFGCIFQQHAIAQNNQNVSESHERWYQVEMIIFARGESNQQKEVWPKNIKLAYPNNLTFFQSADSNNSDGFNLLPVSERKLNSQASAIAKSGSYSLLFHQAWRQLIQAKNTHIFISGGKKFNGHQELEGNISLSVGQYLKFQTNLWLTQFAPVALDASPINSSTTDLALDSTTEESWPELPAIPNSEASTNEQPAEFVTKRIVKIAQQRSMRSVEIHYIDHPLLGIIIKISPLQTPQSTAIE